MVDRLNHDAAEAHGERPTAGTASPLDARELHDLLAGETPPTLVYALGEWAFRALRIPGSIAFASPEQALRELRTDEDIVVYCWDETCVASVYAESVLRSRRFRKVRRFAGGLAAWRRAGFAVLGEFANEEGPPAARRTPRPE